MKLYAMANPDGEDTLTARAGTALLHGTQASMESAANADLCFLPLEGRMLSAYAKNENGQWVLKKDLSLPVQHAADFSKPERTSVLMNTAEIDQKWIAPSIAPLIDGRETVCILAMSYFDDTKTAADWDRQYSPVSGCWFQAYQSPFAKFGIRPSQIVWVNPFEDSDRQMQQKIAQCDILMLPGGAPDLFMQRIKKHRLKKVLRHFRGLAIGVSAGSMIQLGTYHISEDEDYPEFLWCQGLGWLPEFDIEAHYRASRHQKECIEKAMARHGLPVYAIYEQGALIVSTGSGERKIAGAADVFSPESPLWKACLDAQAGRIRK